MIKSLTADSSCFDFQAKEIVFMKLLRIVTNHCKNP